MLPRLQALVLSYCPHHHHHLMRLPNLLRLLYDIRYAFSPANATSSIWLRTDIQKITSLQILTSAFSEGSTHSFSTFKMFKETVKLGHETEFKHGACLYIRQGPEKTDDKGQHRSFPFARCALREQGGNCSFSLKFEQIQSVYIVREVRRVIPC
jgi:hypothetical protein